MTSFNYSAARKMARLSDACRRTCRCLFRAFLWVPVIIVCAILLWGYYVYVYVMNISGECEPSSVQCMVDRSIPPPPSPLPLPGTFPKGPPGVSETISGTVQCNLSSMKTGKNYHLWNSSPKLPRSPCFTPFSNPDTVWTHSVASAAHFVRADHIHQTQACFTASESNPSSAQLCPTPQLAPGPIPLPAWVQLWVWFRLSYLVRSSLRQFHLTDEQLDELDGMVRRRGRKREEEKEEWCLFFVQVDGQPLLRSLASSLPLRTETRSGAVRYCDSCELIKPDRCHHCSMCNRLVPVTFSRSQSKTAHIVFYALQQTCT